LHKTHVIAIAFLCAKYVSFNYETEANFPPLNAHEHYKLD